MLKNWRSSLSGYSDGVRAILRAPSGKLPGLLGPVPQLGYAPAGLETALEAALGSYLQAVVVKSYDQARACLDYLQAANAGKAMVAWLDDDTRQADEAQYQQEVAILERLLADLPGMKDRVNGLAWKLMQCELHYFPLFRRILRGVVVVHDLETARAMFDRVGRMPANERNLETFVTLRGEAMHVDGWLVGGSSKDGEQQGVLAYERELRELPEQLDRHVALINELNGNISEAERVQEARRAEQNTIEKELQRNASRVNEINKAVATTQRELDRLQAELQLAVSVEQQLASEIAGLNQEVQAALERVRAHEKTQREMTGLVEDLRREVEERTLVFRRQQDDLGKARTALAVKRQEAKALRQQLATQRITAQDLKAQIEQRVARAKEAETQLQALQMALEGHRVRLEETQARAQHLLKALQSAEAQAGEFDTQLLNLEQDMLQARQSLNELEVGYRQCLLASQKACDAVAALLEQLQEEVGITDPTELMRYAARANMTLVEEASGEDARPAQEESVVLSEEEEAQLRRLRRRVDTLRSRLRALGGFDPDAPQQYEETRARYEFLSSQIADMEQAALQLRAIIDQLDVTMARQFEITFQTVNARFAEHFTTLFNGGQARLELTIARQEDEDGTLRVNPAGMPGGVEVIVQPPGKKVMDLSLLSGGERALVSAALLFALLEINPPPFCLLDEVDAALDESNVMRFCDILKRLAHDTQFIVITHNRVTMTAAQVIYGVSMGSDSISRLLSLKLEEAPVAGDR
jgi:chromosome segregation protein